MPPVHSVGLIQQQEANTKRSELVTINDHILGVVARLQFPLQQFTVNKHRGSVSLHPVIASTSVLTLGRCTGFQDSHKALTSKIQFQMVKIPWPQ